VVELIEKKRQPLPELDAIYFISPESIESLVDDFKNERKPQYRDIHIFFSGPLDQSSMDMIVKCSNLLPRIKTMVEFNLNFLAYEQRVFHLDSPYTLPKLFPNCNTELLHEVADKLLSLCVTLGDHPNIRFQANSLQLTEQLSTILNGKLSKFTQLTRKKNTLIVLDRSLDPAPLLVHDYNYQAIAYDVIDIPLCTPPSDVISEGRIPDDSFEYEFKTNNEETGSLVRRG